MEHQVRSKEKEKLTPAQAVILWEIWNLIYILILSYQIDWGINNKENPIFNFFLHEKDTL